MSCAKPIPRRPISHSSNSFLKESIVRNKKINNFEEEAIKHYISQDSLNVYHTSASGFWYRYITKVNDEKPRPKIGDEVDFSYEILDLNNEILYSSNELGQVNYIIDKEDIESGLQSGLKLIKEGEEIIFIFPSYNAFGFVGDNEKRGVKQPLIYIVSLIKIK